MVLLTWMASGKGFEMILGDVQKAKELSEELILYDGATNIKAYPLDREIQLS